MLDKLKMTPREKRRYRVAWEDLKRFIKKWAYYKVRRRPHAKLEVAKNTHRRHARRRM